MSQLLSILYLKFVSFSGDKNVDSIFQFTPDSFLKCLIQLLILTSNRENIYCILYVDIYIFFSSTDIDLIK
jgi:hypothetical protein